MVMERRRLGVNGPMASAVGLGCIGMSLWTRDPEKEVLATCREIGIGFVAYSPLGRGFLTGRIKDFQEFAEDDYRRASPRFQGDNFKRNLELVERIQKIAAGKKCSLSQLAVAWVLAQGEDVVPIFGTKKKTYLEENLGALHIELTDQDLRLIDEVVPRGSAFGPRYMDAMMRSLAP
jgi:aryl-alcohol dehydrogenase-like predicted oxidoreductase